jgi:large subunit ribosomal protein L30
MEKNKDKKNQIKKPKIEESLLIAVIRIAGQVKLKTSIANTLYRLRLRKKYSCVLIIPNKDILGLIKKVRHYIAYGEIGRETLIKLLKARAKKIDKKEFDADKIADDFLSNKTLTELGFKPYFSLHPPRKGIDSKNIYPKGVLGNHSKNINKLLERML